MKYNVNFDLTLKKNPYSGLYIAFEGVDGSGKSTQVKKIAKYFEEQGKEVVVTAEPSRKGALGELIQKILQNEISVSGTAIQYLFSADRAEQQEKLIIPALKAGKVVVSDRAFWSSIPYGVLDRNENSSTSNDREQLLVAFSILSIYHQFIAPDKTIYLDLPIETAFARIENIGQQNEIYEKKELLVKVKEVYDWLIEKFADEFVVFNGEKDEESLTREIADKINSLKK